jgi:hypothetical protein
MDTVRRLIPGVWAGMLWSVALLATPAPFVVLERAQAGQVVSHIFTREAAISLLMGMVLVMLERRRAALQAESNAGSGFSLEMLLALSAVFCTVLGYYGLQPAMTAAKVGVSGMLSFGQLHAISLGLFGIKAVLVTALAWRALRQ